METVDQVVDQMMEHPREYLYEFVKALWGRSVLQGVKKRSSKRISKKKAIAALTECLAYSSDLGAVFVVDAKRLIDLLEEMPESTNLDDLPDVTRVVVR